MGMQAYAISDEGHLKALSLEDALRRWRQGDGACWIDAGLRERDSLEPLLDELEVIPFLKQRCLRIEHSTVVLAVPQATFASFPVFADEARTRRMYAAALCLPRLLVTFYTEPMDDAIRIHRNIGQLELEKGDTSNFLCAALVRRAAGTAKATRNLRDEASSLAEIMDADPTAVDSITLEQLKRRAILTDAVAEEQREAFDLIAHAKSSGFDPSEVEGPLGLLTTMGAATERLVDRTNDRIDGLLRRLQDHKAELLNRRLGLLTIISAIFMPLTLLAGIWGMNFENMPELSHPYAYPAALSLMAVLGLSGAWVFYKRGWFD